MSKSDLKRVPYGQHVKSPAPLTVSEWMIESRWDMKQPAECPDTTIVSGFAFRYGSYILI